MEKKPLFITDTILRDAHQSQAATRMRLEDMLPACELLDNMGYWSIECWRDVRLLHEILKRGSVGASARPAPSNAEDEATDALPRAEYSRI